MQRTTLATAVVAVALALTTGACTDLDPDARLLAPAEPGFALGLPASAAVPFPQGWTLRETLPFTAPSCTSGHVAHIGDTDADGVVDVVYRCISSQSVSIWEQDGASFALRGQFSNSGSFQGGVSVGDVDGDATPEIAFSNYHTLRIVESTGNDTYALKHAQTYGYYVEHTVIGDSDGDGRREFLTGQEGFPSRFHVLEAHGDDMYAVETTLTEAGGDVNGGGTRDLDGDGATDLVFGDNEYRFDGSVYVYEDRTRATALRNTRMWVTGVGDSDADGLGEIYGFEPIRGAAWVNGSGMRIVALESTGTADGFDEVFRDGADHVITPFDLDEDGVTEFVRVSNGAGPTDILTVSRPTAIGFETVFTSGSLLAGGGPITAVMPMPDTDADGDPEFAVFQGADIHVLERGEAVRQVALDVLPGSCVNPLSTRRNGVLPVAVLAAPDVDVTAIDPASLALQGIAPLRWAFEDVGTPGACEAGPDGTPDLTLKFDAAAIRATLGDLAAGDVLTLHLIGTLDGTAVSGEDTVVIRGRN